jgi:3-keto-5-aminohexanoate cleavage enzyme
MATVDVFSRHSNAFEGDDPDPNLAVMRALRDRGVSFSMGVREVGHLRKLQRYRELGLLDDHLHLKIFLDEELVGPTPDARGLLMFLDHVAPGLTCDWFTTLYRGGADGQCFRRVCMLAAAMGGHIRTGLGDMPVLDGEGTYTNVDMVEMAADLARRAGREVATAAHARAILTH